MTALPPARALLASALGIWCMAGLSAAPAAKVHTTTASASELRTRRLDAIHRAAVWKAAKIPSMDLKVGPRGPLAFAAGTTVTCDFVARPHGSGSTPKFTCALPSGRELKVRYGQKNGEVYAQVAATRLLWALGFGANRMYPVRVVCHGCPPNPFKDRLG